MVPTRRMPSAEPEIMDAMDEKTRSNIAALIIRNPYSVLRKVVGTKVRRVGRRLQNMGEVGRNKWALVAAPDKDRCQIQRGAQ